MQTSGVPTDVVRVWCTELELTDETTTELLAPDQTFGEAKVLVRLHGAPMEFVRIGLSDGRAPVSQVVRAVGPAGSARIAAHRTFDDAAAGDQRSCALALPVSGTVTVVVCTRNRAAELRECLRRLRLLDHPGLEVVIVDNAPSDDASRRAFDTEVGDDSRFRYVRESRPGLSCARNRGLAEATGEFVAYTDDDVRVDAGWIAALLRGFRTLPDVACVTGLVCAVSLSTPAEHYFDGKVSWSARCDPQVYRSDTGGMDALYPYAPGLFGTGASMAFRTRILRGLGGFDEALGAGTRTAGGEDLDIFVRIIRAGYGLAYEPSAVAWHSHRSDLAGLQAQMYGYGSGLTAFITKHLVNRHFRGGLTRRIPDGIRRALLLSRNGSAIQSAGPAATPDVLPARSLMRREWRGMAAGPLLYVIARRNVPAHRNDDQETRTHARP